jgi:hypothetical protein
VIKQGKRRERKENEELTHSITLSSHVCPLCMQPIRKVLSRRVACYKKTFSPAELVGNN